MLEAKNICYQAGKRSIIKNCSLAVRPGRFTAIVGPNGAGKTSLLKIISRDVTHYTGEVLLNGKDISKIKHKELAILRAVLPQHSSVSFPFSIEQVIEIGRQPHKTTRAENDAIISEVMQLTSLHEFKGRTYQTLSGGEQQRVQMARVMAQLWDQSDFSKYLLLDEPTSSLDLSQQHILLALAKKLCRRGIGVLAILHDLNLASQYADEVLFLKEGETVAYGDVLKKMTQSVIEYTFTHRVEITYDQWTNRPRVFAMTPFHSPLKQESKINK